LTTEERFAQQLKGELEQLYAKVAKLKEVSARMLHCFSHVPWV
jgi:hypothetical protein